MLTNSQLEAAAYRFEMANGNALHSYERNYVAEAGLETKDPDRLADEICLYLDSSSQIPKEHRSTAFWALGKYYHRRLLPFFHRHLAHELDRDMNVAYQIMIALDNLDEEVWPHEKRSFSILESSENREAALR